MPSLYGNRLMIPFQQGTTLAGAVSAATLFPTFIAPCDLDVVGIAFSVGTAPGTGATTGFTVNVSVVPTSQASGGSETPNPYNLWTAANVPTIAFNAKTYPAVLSTFPTVVKNLPYALNYPLPGPSGTQGYATAQSTSQTTETPVTSPPTLAEYQMAAMVAPDNTYTDYNGITSTPASLVHAGDVLSFVTTALAGGVGASAGLSGVLFFEKH